MISIVVDRKNINNNIAKIDNINDINHIVNVYRYKENSDVRLVDGEFEYIAKIIRISKREILLEIISKKENEYDLDINIDIAIGIIKNDKMTLLLQKLTEIGVRKIIPLKTERVVVKINEKKEKWDETIKESMKQCRAVRKTQIDDIKNINDIEYNTYDKIIFLYEKSSKSSKITDIIDNKDKNILCIIGPEGGFTDSEVEKLKNKKAIEVSLGNRILRAETAAILVSSVISHCYGY